MYFPNTTVELLVVYHFLSLIFFSKFCSCFKFIEAIAIKLSSSVMETIVHYTFIFFRYFVPSLSSRTKGELKLSRFIASAIFFLKTKTKCAEIIIIKALLDSFSFIQISQTFLLMVGEN